jgi:glycosyltransferase involved in cell wall biosynthesis
VRLGIVATHPVQYQVQWYRALAERSDLDLVVYYALLPSPAQQGVGFGVDFAWDVPLLDGYRWVELPNAARRPSLHGFFGSRTPTVGRVLAADRPDAVIVSGWHALPLLQAARACRGLGVPCLVRGESSGLRKRPAWARAIHRRLLSGFDACLAIGIANRRFYRANDVPEERIFDVPYFVDGERFRAQAERLRPRRSALRAEWGIGPDDTCVLFAGKLVEKKRVNDLLQACARALRSGSAIRPLLVGTGEREGAARALAASLDLPVTFAGFLNQTEISRAYVAADCLALPSDYGETWGLVVNEAMHHGLPAIVSDRVGCGPDLVEDGVTGYVFPCGDIEALGRALTGIASDPARRRDMGDRALRRVAGYSEKRAVEGTLEGLEFATRTPVGAEA